jgi:capsular exopolysaccharide family
MKRVVDALRIAREKQIDALNMPSLPKEFILKSISDSNINTHIVTHFYPKSLISEQYLRLRANVKTLMKTKHLKVLAVTSSVDSEGKSITALNLAVALAKDVDCKSVLLIDCDLRRGSIGDSLAFSSKAGLSEYLMINAETDSILYKTKINKLTIIPRGKIADNPTELLSSEKMKELLKKLREKFDIIILDTAPVIPVADAGIVCGLADGTMVVVRAGKTQRGIVKHAAELLRQNDVNMLGYVLTHVEYYIPGYIYKYV